MGSLINNFIKELMEGTLILKNKDEEEIYNELKEKK
jgi:hypothetical protein